MIAIEDLYNCYKGHIFCLCRRYVKDPVDAEDIVQTVFIKAWRSFAKFENKSQYFTWLYRIAVNECLNYLKKHRREFIEFNELWMSNDNTNFSNTEKQLLWRIVFKSVNQDERMIIFLYAVEGLTMSEVAEVTGFSRQTLHKKWNTIKNKLVKKFRGSI